VIPSACSVIAEHTRMRLPDWKPDPEFGRRTLAQLLEGVQRAMAARPAIGEERFVDIGHPELNAEPLRVAERIYDFAALRLTDDVRTAMAQWTEQNQAGSRGQHRYTAEEFGLTEDEIRAAFAEYLDTFGGYCVAKA
jgi:Sulfotransferase family